MLNSFEPPLLWILLVSAFPAACVAECPIWNPESACVGDRLARYRRLESPPGPQARWRVMEDRSATSGQTFSAKFREKVLGGSVMFDDWFGGVRLLCTGDLPSVVSPDYLSAQDDCERAREELAGLAPLGKIHWYSEGSCPSRLVAKGDKVHVVRDWSGVSYPRNSVLANPSAQYGAMDEFLSLLGPGASMGGTDWHID